MDKYFLEILKSVNTIIIPGLGALTVTNASTGEILFMSYLNYDDGKLAEFISEKEGISENDARNLIAKYVREIEAKLNSGESYDIYQFGSFLKNNSGEIEFSQWNSKKATIQNELEQDQRITEEKEQKKESDSEKVLIEIDTTLLKKSVKKKKEPSKSIEKDPKAERTDLIITEDAVVPEIEGNKNIDETINEQVVGKTIENVDPLTKKDSVEKEALSSSYTEEDQWKDDLDILPITVKKEQPKKPILEKVKRDKKRKSTAFYTFLVLGVFFIGGTLTFIMFYNSLEKFIPFMANEETVSKDIIDDSEVKPSNIETPIPKKEIEQAESLKDTFKIKSTNIPEILDEEISAENFIQTSTGKVDKSKPFHIIGGAFSNKTNADRYLSKLIKDGNPALIIGRFDNLFIVSIASFETQASANNSLPNLKNTSKNAWVFRWP